MEARQRILGALKNKIVLYVLCDRGHVYRNAQWASKAVPETKDCFSVCLFSLFSSVSDRLFPCLSFLFFLFFFFCFRLEAKAAMVFSGV